MIADFSVVGGAFSVFSGVQDFVAGAKAPRLPINPHDWSSSSLSHFAADPNCRQHQEGQPAVCQFVPA
jgi:hypothetical protein